MKYLLKISALIRSPRNLILLCLVPCALYLSSCGYSFKDVSIPPEIKTVRVQYIKNKARYVNPQLSPQLTERLRLKINNQTRLTNVQSDDAERAAALGLDAPQSKLQEGHQIVIPVRCFVQGAQVGRLGPNEFLDNLPGLVPHPLPR